MTSVSERRRSLGEIAKKASPQDVHITVKSVEMDDEMRDRLIGLVKHNVAHWNTDKQIAQHLKRSADESLPGEGSWHVVVGRAFGSYVTHEHDHFLYVYANDFAVLVFKTA